MIKDESIDDNKVCDDGDDGDVVSPSEIPTEKSQGKTTPKDVQPAPKKSASNKRISKSPSRRKREDGDANVAEAEKPKKSTSNKRLSKSPSRRGREEEESAKKSGSKKRLSKSPSRRRAEEDSGSKKRLSKSPSRRSTEEEAETKKRTSKSPSRSKSPQRSSTRAKSPSRSKPPSRSKSPSRRKEGDSEDDDKQQKKKSKSASKSRLSRQEQQEEDAKKRRSRRNISPPPAAFTQLSRQAVGGGTSDDAKLGSEKGLDMQGQKMPPSSDQWKQSFPPPSSEDPMRKSGIAMRSDWRMMMQGRSQEHTKDIDAEVGAACRLVAERRESSTYSAQRSFDAEGFVEQEDDTVNGKLRGFAINGRHVLLASCVCLLAVMLLVLVTMGGRDDETTAISQQGQDDSAGTATDSPVTPTRPPFVVGRLPQDASCGSVSEMYMDYRGTLNTTINGKPCQRWDDQFPHLHTTTDYEFPDAGLGGGHNYCRNPNGDAMAWCYTVDPDTPIEYCNVPECDTPSLEGLPPKDTPPPDAVPSRNDAQCGSSSIKYMDYRGIVSTTVNGRECQRWDSQFPHLHTVTDYEYPDKGLGAHNYCRNPNGQPSAWCYTTDPEVRFEYCDIPQCGYCGLDFQDAESACEVSCLADTDCPTDQSCFAEATCASKSPSVESKSSGVTTKGNGQEGV